MLLMNFLSMKFLSLQAVHLEPMVNSPTVLILVLGLASDAEMGSTDCIPTVPINYKRGFILFYELKLRVGAKEDSCNQLKPICQDFSFVLQDGRIHVTVMFMHPNAFEYTLNTLL